jgi:hemoglobin
MSGTLKEIDDENDVRLLVETFYHRVRNDDLLGPVVGDKIQDWSLHLDTMSRFWQSVLFKKPAYDGIPFSNHENLPLNNAHFYRWITLFNQTIDELFVGSLAEEAKFYALNTAEVFRNKISSRRF